MDNGFWDCNGLMEDPALVDELEALALELADVAQQMHLQGLRSGYISHAKGTHGDLVTDIDRRAESAMIDLIRSNRPQDAIVGEEQGEQPGTRVCWVLDPIDGTANYVRRSTEFAVSIGVEVDGKPVMGVVRQTLTGTTWATRRGQTFRDGHPVSVSGCVDMSGLCMGHRVL